MRRLSLFAGLGILLILLSGNVFSQITNIQISTASPQLQNEEQVFYCPTDENIIISTWRDFRLGYRRCAIGRSTDGGATWTNALNDVMMFTYQTDPAMTVDRDGNFYCCYMDGAEQNSALVVIKSTDKGQSWEGPSVAAFYYGSIADKEFITCDRTGGPHDGNLYVAWSQFWGYSDSSAIMIVRSTDGGTTFGDYRWVTPNRYPFDDGSIFTAEDLFAQPIVGSDGSVYVFLTGYDGPMDECDSSASLYMSKSTDGGLTWPISRETIYQYGDIRTQKLDGNLDVFFAPAGDVDITGGPYNGNIYISTLLFSHEDPSHHGEIGLLKSTDGGSSWTGPHRVNDDPLGVDVDQFHPWLIVNQDGVVITIFYDRRIDPNHYLFDLFAAYSYDGGESFTPNHRITDVSSNPDDLGKAGSIAEYIGVAAFHDNVTAVWTDLRNGNQDVFAATYDIPILPPRLYDVPDGSYLTAEPDSLVWGNCWYVDDVSYRLELSDNPEFSSFIVSSDQTPNKYFNAGLGLDDGFYHWRVKGFLTSVDDSTDYSQEWSFVIDREAPIMPVLAAPEEGSTTGEYRPEFSWTVSSVNEVSPEYYEIEISDNDLFTGGYNHHVSELTETVYPMPEDLPGADTYYWRVNHYDLSGNESGYTAAGSFDLVDYICGDANGDFGVNIGDVVYIGNYVFRNGECATSPPIGCPPEPYEAGDCNCDGSVNIGDAVYLGNVIFRPGSPGPCAACP